MSSVTVSTRAGKTVSLDDGAVETFRAGLRGGLVLEGDADYDEVRALWNAMIDRRPALIARCAGTADVIHSLKLAREHDLLFSVRGAGHNIAGKASCDGGLMIDLSGMRDVRVDPAARTARIGPGATLGDIDHETQAFGLAIPLGIKAVQLTMLGSGLLAGERPAAREWLGLVLSFAGLVALTRPGLAQPDPLGAGLMLVAGVAWGVYSLRGRGTAAPLATNASNFARSVPLALLASGAGLAMASPQLTTTGALLALASGAVASGLGYAIWYSALRGLSATQAAIVQLSVPPATAAGGVLALGEHLTVRLILAGAMILGGIALAISARRR